MTNRASLTPSQRKAVRSSNAAAVLVESLNERIASKDDEISNLEKTVVDLQDKYENVRAKFTTSDKRNTVLEALSQYSLIAEIFKFLLSGVGVGYGINLASSGNHLGWVIAAASASIYTFITWKQVSITKKASEAEKK